MVNTSSADIINYVSNQISYYHTLIFPPIALGFNMIALVTCFRKGLSQTSIGYLLKWQYIVDSVFLINVIFFWRSIIVLGYSPTNLSDIWCRVGVLWTRFLLHLSSWIQVIITIDRFINIYLDKNVTLNTRKSIIRGTIMIIFVFVLLIAANSINLFYSLSPIPIFSTSNSTAPNATIVSTVRSCSASYNIKFASDIISVLMRTIIPITVMIFVDIFLVWHIFNTKNKVFTNRAHRKESHFTFSVIVLNCMFFFSNFPLSIALILQNVYVYSNTNLSALQLAQFNFFLNFAVTLSYSYQSLEFVTNFAINRLFRREVLALFQVKRKVSSDCSIR